MMWFYICALTFDLRAVSLYQNNKDQSVFALMKNQISTFTAVTSAFDMMHGVRLFRGKYYKKKQQMHLLLVRKD